MLNIIINILFGFILETIYFGYIFNKIKNVKYKSTYIIFLISYVFSLIFTQFTFNNIIFPYIISSALFSVLYCIIHKTNYKITDALLMLNVILISSILFAIPILFIGYNEFYIVFNVLMKLVILLIIYKVNLNVIYIDVIKSWNRGFGGKFKSVTTRNVVLILIYISITIINVFLNNFFLNIYEKLL